MNVLPHDAFPPGKLLTVGSHKVSIIKYISQGGFAYVYTCKIEPAFQNSDIACLKRVVVPNKSQLTLLRQEVDAMKRLRGNAHIVSYIDSHASRLPSQNVDQPQQQQYEVMLLMEYCSGMGLIDFMNTRLTQRLSEHEVLSIMGQITTAVAMCHHLDPPLIHRDIKIENVLIDGNGTYKLCDFGSAVGYRKVPTNQHELQLVHEDIMQHTTPQYRAPEMIDLSKAFPIDDKSDVWALGVFLYKLCYFTTPFELPNQRTLQELEHLILASSRTLRMPHTPNYSSRLQNIISCCLREDPRRRPNALQLLQEVCQMQNISVMPDVIPYSIKVQQLSNMNIENSSVHKSSSSKPEAKHTLLHKSLSQSDLKKEPLSKLDPSRLYKMASNPVLSARPKSEIYPSSGRDNISSVSLQNMVQQQLDASAQGVSNICNSEDRGPDTIEFLRAKEDSGVNSAQNTGGSIKVSLRQGLRNFSTGGSIKAQISGQLGYIVKHHTKADETRLQGPEEIKRRSSIQRRVQQLLFNKEKKPAKTATGYGKYTDQEDISAINHYELSRLAAPVSPTNKPQNYDFDKNPSRQERKEKTSASKHDRTVHHTKSTPHTATIHLPKSRSSPTKSLQPPPCPPELQYRVPKDQVRKPVSNIEKAPAKPSFEKKRPPPKPTKPLHLKVDESRNISNTSEIFLPDLDDLEKLFSMRYPSCV